MNQSQFNKIERYSDKIPYLERRYWYFTLHGTGPGTIPNDLHILETQEGQNDKGTWGLYICLDGVLNTSELKEYDLRELAPPEEKCSEDHIIRQELAIGGWVGMIDKIWKDEEGIHVHVVNGYKDRQHNLLNTLLLVNGYKQIKEIIEEDHGEYYTADHIFERW